MSPPEGAAKLRYFRYSPPMGGFGGDWDSLDAQLPYASAAELAAVLARLGHAGPSPLPSDTALLGFCSAGGEKVQLGVDGRDFATRGAGSVSITFAVYVTTEDVARALRFERWLDAQGIRALPKA